MSSIDNETRIASFRTEYAADLIGLPGKPPLLSWAVESSRSGSKQVSYEIECSTTPNFSDSLARLSVQGDESQFIVAPGGQLSSREIRHYRVRIETELGHTEWSETLTYEAGLLSPSDFAGMAIGDSSLADDPITLLRMGFNVGKTLKKARLYATAHGVFNLFLNGKTVSEELFSPGWTNYWKRQLVLTHDVTSFLNAGDNVWGVELGDGWFRSKFGFVNTYNLYGNHTSFLGQLELEFEDGTSQIITTNNKWLSSQGEARLGSIYDGSTIDLTQSQVGWKLPNFDDSAWNPVTVRIMDKSVFEPRTAEPVRVIKEFDVELSSHNNAVRVNTNQNISGWLRLRVKGSPGSKLTLRHAEVLEPTGDLHIKALRHAKATDTYILDSSSEVELEPIFTFHGFQFADIHKEGQVEILEVKAIAISSDVAVRSEIETSHPGINKLASNIYWSLRDNMVSLPTDCPQRDERMGWTGDAQVISYAAHTMVDGYQFFKSWMRDVALDQKASGEVPVVVPDILAIQFPKGMFFSVPTVGWGDAATVIPWSMYERFGDLEILTHQIHSMREWVRCLSDLREGSLIPESAPQLGDWLDPDAPPSRPADAKVSGNFMANAYLAYSSLLLSKAEELVGSKQSAEKYFELYVETKNATWEKLGAEAMKTPTGAAILLQFELAPEQIRKQISDTLAQSVIETAGMIKTGFLGTPVILDALSQFGNTDAAYAMLLRTKIRSWLYPLSVGATSMWERWEAIREDGSIDGGEMDDAAEGSEGSMISFNHYAYGAVLDWIYRNVAGITSVVPGYKTISICPKPHASLTKSSASIKTGYGAVKVDWRVGQEELTCEISIPFGVNASLDLPASAESELFVNGSKQQLGFVLGHGTHHVALTNPMVSK